MIQFVRSSYTFPSLFVAFFLSPSSAAAAAEATADRHHMPQCIYIFHDENVIFL